MLVGYGFFAVWTDLACNIMSKEEAEAVIEKHKEVDRELHDLRR